LADATRFASERQLFKLIEQADKREITVDS
jgi:hypothetical protein